MQTRSYALATALLAVIFVCYSAAPARSADSSKQVDTRINVVFLPISGTSAAVATAEQHDLVKKLIGSVNSAHSLYFACPQDTAATPPCDASMASILVVSRVEVPTTGNMTLVVASFDLRDRFAIGSVTKDLGLKAGASDADLENALRTALTLNDAEIVTLIGTPVVRNGALTIVSGFQPFIQLIPDVGSNNPTYVDLLQNLLAMRGIASVPSQFNAGTITTGAVGADVLCGLGQRYLVYEISSRTENRILSLNTRVETRATGHLYDCPTRSDLAFGDTARTFATNTKQSLASFLALLGSLFVSKTNSWQNATTTGALVTAIVDQTPADIHDHTAEVTLQKFVDSFCRRIKALPTPSPVPSSTSQPTPTPTPTPSGRERQSTLPVASPAAASTTTTATTGTATQSLDIGNFLADAPPLLKCGKPVYDTPYVAPASAPLFNRRP